MPAGGVLEFTASNVQVSHPIQEPNISLEPGEYVKISVQGYGLGCR